MRRLPRLLAVAPCASTAATGLSRAARPHFRGALWPPRAGETPTRANKHGPTSRTGGAWSSMARTSVVMPVTVSLPSSHTASMVACARAIWPTPLERSAMILRSYTRGLLATGKFGAAMSSREECSRRGVGSFGSWPALPLLSEGPWMDFRIMCLPFPTSAPLT